MKTIGFSGKMLATIAAACGAQFVLFIANLIASGEFDRTELATLVSMALTAVFGFVSGYAKAPDTVAPEQVVP